MKTMSTYRKIIHVDMDAFFASVEQRDRPELRGQPVVVGGSPEKRGAIAAASYEARKYGIHSAMPSRLAAKLCPHLIFIHPKHSKYQEISVQIRDIFQRFTDLVEPVAFDEAYLDVTQNKVNEGSAMAIARQIKALILAETQLTASAGISVNKFLAKMASGLNKPDGLSLIHPGQAEDFVAGLPIEKFHGIGKATAQKMHRLNIKTGQDLKAMTEEQLVQRFGKVGHYFFNIARGRDNRAVNPNRIRKSVGAERSFDPDLSVPTEMLSHLYKIAENVEQRLKANQKEGHTLTLKVKYANYQQMTRSRTIQGFFETTADIYAMAKMLFEQNCDSTQSVRLLGIAIAGFEREDSQQAFNQLSLTFK